MYKYNIYPLTPFKICSRIMRDNYIKNIWHIITVSGIFKNINNTGNMNTTAYYRLQQHNTVKPPLGNTNLSPQIFSLFFIIEVCLYKGHHHTVYGERPFESQSVSLPLF